MGQFTLASFLGLLALICCAHCTPVRKDVTEEDVRRAMQARRSYARKSIAAFGSAYGVGDAGASLSNQCVGEYVIPVAFTVVHFKDDFRMVDQATIDKQLKVLQDGFKQKDLQDRFKFQMHSTVWVEDDEWAQVCVDSVKQAKYAKDVTKVLNVYICPIKDAIGAYGNTYFPWDAPEADKSHGVIIDIDTLPGSTAPGLEEGKNLIQEVGIFFGLFWISEGACSNGPGDYVEDTPPQDEVYGCPHESDTCKNKPGKDLINNYMGWTSDACKDSFTVGQINRMNYMFLQYKPLMSKYSSDKPCALDGVFRAADGHIYMFSADKYYQYDEATRRFATGYPKQISSYWKGVPENIDDVTRDNQGNTIFIKNSQEYKFDDASNAVAAGYPKSMQSTLKNAKVVFSYIDGLEYYLTSDQYYTLNTSSQAVSGPFPVQDTFKGVPKDVDTALAWYNGWVYFFKGQFYYRWSPKENTVVKETIDEWWKKEIEELKDYTALWECNGLTYFFKGDKYWRFNDEKFQVDVGYSKNISSEWQGVPNNFDDAFLWSDENSYFFKGDTCYEYNLEKGAVEQSGKINEMWKGVPNDIDAVFTSCNDLTYFFKGSDYYRFNDTSMSLDAGYPKKISEFWKGVPDNIDSVFRWSNGLTYFFKGDKYYRFNGETEKVDDNYPQPIANWRGVLWDEM